MYKKNNELRSLLSVLILFTLILLLASCKETNEKIKSFIPQKNKIPKVLLQPYNEFPKKSLLRVKKKIEENYNFEVHIAEEKKMPKAAFVNIKSPRYRADSMILFQKRHKPDTIDYILGLTTVDISTTKKDNKGNTLQPEAKYNDWGLFGLGYVPGPSCIVSTFRLGKDKTRLNKISLHEIGHNLGLPHCKNSKICVMRDAAESIKTIDYVEATLCKDCKSKI